MTLDELRNLLTAMQADPTTATDEQLAAAVDAIRVQVADARKAGATAETITLLTELRDVRDAVVAEQGARTETAAQMAQDAEALLAEFDKPAAETPAPAEPVAETVTEQPPAGGAPAEREPELIAASGAARDLALAKVVAAEMAKVFAAQTVPVATAPQGRTGRPGTTATPPASARDAVTLRVLAAGSDALVTHGQEITDSAALGRVFSERLRGAYQGSGGTNERMFVARVQSQYPESRILHGGDDVDGANYTKIENAVGPRALVAAGGLCAPLEVLYDVDVIGSVARPVQAALASFAVDRGGIQYRPNYSAAAAVFGAGTWTLAQDIAGTSTKGCYVVECPGIQTANIQAIYSCLEFGNISTRFDPESTAANVQLGMIAHHRLAENQLLAAIAAGSKALSSPQLVGATRDILATLDKTIAYFRNRHRIDTAVSLTLILPAWVKSLMRADIARQMAAGDWMSALGVSDQLIEQWFGTRGVSPAWHLDGPTGTAEVQTITETGAPTGGTFTLTYKGTETTAAIAYNATAATIQAALEALPSIQPGEVTVAGGPLNTTAVTVTFLPGESGDVVQMTSSSTGLTGGTTPAVTVTTATQGGGAITVNGISISSQTYSDAPAGTAVPGFPDQIDSLLFVTGTWLFLDGGSLDLGLVRDSALNSRNAYRQFTETFEGVANRGVESLRVVMNVQPTGAAVGTIAAAGITD